MKPIKQFAKVFDLEKGQILITKEYDEESGQEVIRVKSSFEDVDPSAILGYTTFEEREKAFDLFTKKNAQLLFNDFEKLLR